MRAPSGCSRMQIEWTAPQRTRMPHSSKWIDMRKILQIHIFPSMRIFTVADLPTSPPRKTLRKFAIYGQAFSSYGADNRRAVAF